MGNWNERSATQYRGLEQEQRELAAGATSPASRDIHLEFADKYQRLAEELEAEIGSARAGHPVAEK